MSITDKKVLKFWAEDVSKVFDIPCSTRDVKGRDADINSESVDFIKRTLRMDQAGAHSLRAAEESLKKDINRGVWEAGDSFRDLYHGPCVGSIDEAQLCNDRLLGWAPSQG